MMHVMAPDERRRLLASGADLQASAPDERRRLLASGADLQASAPDERRRLLASGADLQVSERYDGAQPCSDLNISVATLKSTRWTGRQPVQFLQNR